MSRKPLRSTAALLLALLFVLTACSSKTATTAVASNSAGGAAPKELAPATLTFFFNANADEAKTRQKIIDAFMAKYPQIKIKTELSGDDPTQKLLTEAAGGQAPDIIMTWELDYSALAEKGLYADLTNYIKADPDFSNNVMPDYAPALVDTFKWKGKQYALPEQYAGVVLYYNKKLFREAGLPFPPASWTDKTWTYDKFLDDARKLTQTDASGKITQYGYADMWWAPLSASVWAQSNGGSWYSPYVNPTKSTITDPNFVAGLQFYADLANKYKVAPTPEATQATSATDLFMQGKVAMGLVGHWFYPAFSQAGGLDMDVAAFPVGPNGSGAVSDVGTTGLAVSATSKNQDAAWAFIKFSCGPEGQKLIAESGLFVPTLRSVGKSDSFLKANSKLEHAQVFIDAMDHAAPLPISPSWAETTPIWTREMDKLLLGKASAADVTKTLQPQIQALLDQSAK